MQEVCQEEAPPTPVMVAAWEERRGADHLDMVALVEEEE